VINLENIVSEKVKQLCAKNPAYEGMLHEVLEADKKCANPGFQFKDLITVQGGHLNAMVQAGIVNKSYETNSCTHWRLSIPQKELEDILDDIELTRLKDEKMKLAAVPVTTVLLTPALVDEFEALVKTEPDMLMYWAQRLNPRIIGMVRERAACLISMASPPDKGGIMRRCHTLIHGPPGTAKSLLITYIKHYFGAVGISPKTTSEVGLTTDARGAGTDGALVLAHDGVLTIEEIEKFPKHILEALFEAMSTGEFDVNKGDVHERRRAEIRGIAVGNDISKLPDALKDRFDMTFYYEIPNSDAEKKITDDLYQQWLTGREDYRGERLRAYLAWINPFEPEITPEMIAKVTSLKNAYIDLTEKKPDIREKEAFLKVAFTIAKINHRSLIINDYLQAVTLVDCNLGASKLEALEKIAKGLV
jgi:DNA replicative helicase MCM subunit Mcm2 (Cdc46/Mcm family)